MGILVLDQHQISMKEFQNLSAVDTVVVVLFFGCVITIAYLIGKMLWHLTKRK